MSIDVSNVTAARSLAISISGTDYVQRSTAAGALPGVLPSTDLQNDVASGGETVSGALRRVSADTLAAIEQALKTADPSASLMSYAAGAGWKDRAGTFFNLEA